MRESQKKHLATQVEKNPSRAFIDNKVIGMISENSNLSEYLKNKKLNYWNLDDEYVTILFNELKNCRGIYKLNSIIVFINSSNDIPVALTDFGTKLVEVIPGNVFISRK